jgi:hypothetical protein
MQIIYVFIWNGVMLSIRILNLMSMYIAHKPKDPYIDLA